MSEVIGTTDKIQGILDRYCTGGYGYGVIGQANIIYLTKHYPELVRIQRVYRLGDALVFTAPVKDSRKFGEFLEDIFGLKDYPIVDEETFSDYLCELQDVELLEIIRENNLNDDIFWQVWCNGDRNFDWEQDYVYPSFDVDELVAEVRLASQSWNTHYVERTYHVADVCAWCADVSLPSSELERA